MHAQRPSLTAAIVSFMRGAVSKDGNAPCFDPVAADLLPAPFAQVLKLLEGDPRRRRLLEPLVRGATFGLVNHIELRTAVIDQAVADGVLAGARQLVVLGAGLDSRAWRMGALKDVDVFEVDHPNTQAWKRQRMNGHAQTAARSVHFVAVDFERTSLGQALDATSFRRDVPTFWVWEGVTPYLHPRAIEATLTDVSARSAPRSRMAVSYCTPDILAATGFRPLTYPVFKIISEPLVGIMAKDELAQLLGRHGFKVLSDELPAEAGARYGRSTRRGMLSPSERVAVALR